MSFDDFPAVIVTRMTFPVFADERGLLLPVEHLAPHLPFVPVRSFVICGVPEGKSRAEHTLTCHQILIVVRGSVHVAVREGETEKTHILDSPGAALFVPEGRWIALRQFTREAILLVLAAGPYQRRD